MEGNHMSPPPAPPTPTTDGDDSCRIEVTDLATDGVTLLVCLCGLVGNGAVLWLLGFRIRRNPITVYILNLAVADFTFLLFMVTSALLYMMQNICSTVVSLMYLRSLFLLSLFSYNMGLYLLTAISIERSSVDPSSTNPRGSTLLSSSQSSSSSSSLFPSASGISCSSSTTPTCPPRLFSCSPASTAASTPSSISWWGAAGGTAPWCPSRSPCRGSLRGRKTTWHAATILRWMRWPQPVEAFPPLCLRPLGQWLRVSLSNQMNKCLQHFPRRHALAE
ncbi:uncharacterized protein LOC129207008 isoform X2 [Grus americana]|uniref:uncharacterized protein LOC129207008 isoform X2 n=1 Tax=Grus americana TaxID=9117 RepID=UPI002407A6E8|nr:uncharacterized protein LOC129207008 isoform X2 [Grus americana]